MTKDDLAFVARAIAVANKHSAPDDYAKEVVDGAFSSETPPVIFEPVPTE